MGTARRGWFVLLAGLLLAVVGAGAATQASDAGRAALPEISIGDAEGTHGQTGTVTMSFPVTLSASSADTVTVDYKTVEGSAIFQDDFAPATGTLSFAPGETSKTIDVTLLPEPGITIEPDETFTVELTNSVNATIARGTAVGTVHFDGRPKAGQVNVRSLGTGGQCVRTIRISRCVPLKGEKQLKISEIRFVDPRKGVVSLRGLACKARFFGSPFSLDEVKVGAKKQRTLVLQLSGGNFSACGTGGTKAFAGTRSISAAVKKGKPVVRRLFGNGKGRFRTRGRYSAGTVRGTYWATVDRCDGTLTYVFRGVVSVHDFVLDKDVNVRAGHGYLAGPLNQK